MDWFERTWFEEVEKSHNIKAVEKPHNTVAKETKNKSQQQSLNTVAKEMKNSHKDDDFNSHIDDDSASQRLDLDTGHTKKPHTIKDVNSTDNSNSCD